MSVNESVSSNGRTMSRIGKRRILRNWKALIVRAEGLAKTFSSFRGFEWIDTYWEEYEKRSLFRKWQSFQSSGHWF